MNKVIEMLEGDGEFLEMPHKPFQSLEEMPAEDDGNDAAYTVDFPLLLLDQMDSICTSINRN